VAVHVAVLDPLPIFQQGVVAILSAAGYTVDEPADLLAWAQQKQSPVVLLTLGKDRDWQLLERLCRSELRAVVIAIVEESEIGTGVRAIRTGARSVLSRQATAATMRRTVEATIDGQAVVPAAVAATLVAGAPSGQNGQAVPSENQLSWLRRIAAGRTVSQLAGEIGYSERAMYRLLQALYQQLGVTTRMQAIMRAQELGLLSAPDARPGP
jgi:DNA-binding NarL/FixJ family response regulator